MVQRLGDRRHFLGIDPGVGEVILVHGHGTVRTEVLDQRTNDGPVNPPQLPDPMAKAEHVAIDPVGEPTSFRHQFGTLAGQHPQFLNLVRSHPRFAPQAVQAVLGELRRVETVGLAPDMAGVGRIDDRRVPSPGQAEGHVVLAGRLAGVTEVRFGNDDFIFQERAQDPCLRGAIRATRPAPSARSGRSGCRWESRRRPGRIASGSRHQRHIGEAS